MKPGLLCLNDARVRLFDQQGLQLSDSATLVARGDRLTSGETALAQCRIHPTHSYNQHWAQLNQTPFSRALPGYRHNADLAFFQLRHWLQGTEADELVIAHSLAYDASQLALLAGLVQATGKKVSAFINQALLQSAALADDGLPAGHFFHLDLSLHNARLTELRWQQGALAVVGQTQIADQGLAPLYQAWLKQLARECVRQSRYDPLHSAEAEQQLFNLLPHSLELLQAGDGLLELESHKIELQQTWLHQLTDKLRHEVQSHISQAPLLLAPTAHWLPGLAANRLTDVHSQRGLAALLPLLGGPLQEHSRIPLAAAVPAEPRPAASPTHLLQGHTAQALRHGLRLSAAHGQFIFDGESDQGATILCTGGHWYIEPGALALSLNGRRLAQRQALAAGDQLLAGEARLMLIQAQQDAPHGS